MEPPPPPSPPSKDEPQQPQPQQQQVTEAGAVRALIRAAGSVYRTVVFGSFPRRVPVKAIGPLTDRLATAYDAVSALREAHQEQRQQLQQQQENQQGQSAKAAGKGFLTSGLFKGGGAWLQKAHLFGSTALHAAPGLIRSAALGTAVFELYEAAATPPPNPWLLPVTCTAAGAAAGACHGALYVAWEYGRVALARLRASLSLKAPVMPVAAVEHVLGGTTAAHALAHGTLFGSFEVVKEALFALTGAKHEEPLGVVLVGTAGAVAGFCEEAVSHFTQSWEQEGVSSLRAAVKRHGAPPLRVIARTAALPSAVGFLSFEFGREAVLSRFGNDDDDDGGGGGG